MRMKIFCEGPEGYKIEPHLEKQERPQLLKSTLQTGKAEAEASSDTRLYNTTCTTIHTEFYTMR